MSGMTNGNDHERFVDDVAAYVLNAMEDTEAQRFEEHLARCDECQRELAAMQTVVEALPEAAPTRQAPPELRDRVMAVVRADAEQASEQPTARRARWPVARPRWVASAITAAAVAAIAVVLVVSGGGGSGRTYVGVVHAPGASVSLRQSGSSAELRVSGIPAPPSGRIYEVWLQRGTQAPAPTSTLFAITSGSVKVPGNLHGVRTVMVTAEPRPNGSRRPTRAPIIVVRLT